jgi:hypothetical protein
LCLSCCVHAYTLRPTNPGGATIGRATVSKLFYASTINRRQSNGSKVAHEGEELILMLIGIDPVHMVLVGFFLCLPRLL